MGYINQEIPDEVHDKLRTQSALQKVPQRLLIIKALRDMTEDFDHPEDVDEVEDVQGVEA